MTNGQSASERLRSARKRAGLSVESVAARAGYSVSGVRAIENGQNGLRLDAAARFAPILGTTASWLLTGEGDEQAEAMVPIIGRVGADNEGNIVYSTADETGELVPIPPGGSDSAVALKVVGHSMGNWAPEGSLIYFENQRTPPTPDMLGWPCVVETEDGRVLLKRLLKGSRPGLYDLESLIGPTISDVRLHWAAEITANVPPRQASRIIRYAGVKQVA